MLQQTQVDRVLPKYHEWLAKYPTLDVAGRRRRKTTSSRTWRPLGYNIRPRRLQWIAREAVERFGGALPSDEQTLLSFKGLGRYTVGRRFAASRSASARRSSTPTSRGCCSACSSAEGDPKAHATIRHLWAISEALVPRKPRLRLQPGADGLRRDGVHGAQAAVPAVPDEEADARRIRSHPTTIAKARRREGAKA